MLIPSHVTKEYLENEYWINNKTIKQIAKENNKNEKTVARWFNKLNIKKKITKKENRIKLTKKLLIQEYVKNKLSITQLSKKFDYCVGYISSLLKKFKIRRMFYVDKHLNKKFGKLTPIEVIKQIRAASILLCKCDCGNFKKIKACAVISGNTRSCGCIRRKRGINNPIYTGYKDIYGRFWYHLKKNAEIRALEFTITIEYAWNLLQKQKYKCAFSGIDIKLALNRYDEQIETTASLDRIDSNKGYIEGNIQWVHKHINIMKQNFEDAYFINICDLVSKYRKIKINET